MVDLFKLWQQIPTGKIHYNWVSFNGFKKWALYAGYRRGAQLILRNEDADYNPVNCYWDPFRKPRGRKPSFDTTTFYSDDRVYLRTPNA